MTTTRTFTYRPDAGGAMALRLTSQNTDDALNALLFIRACDSPADECPCMDTTLIVRPRAEHETGAYDARLALDLDTRAVAVLSDPEGLLSGRMASLEAQLRGDLGTFVGERVRRRKLPRDAWRTADLDFYARGDVLPFHEVHPREFDLMAYVDDRAYWVVDRYCVNPRCSCQELVCEIRGLQDATRETVRIALDADGFVNPPSELAIRVWDEVRATYGLGHLRARRRQMRDIAKELTRRLRTKAAVTAAAQAPQRVGRNDPCPCGSGDKYKKCCAKAEQAITAR